MSEQAPLTLPPRGVPPGSEDGAAADPRIVRAEQRLAMLRDLAELGMALARDLARRTLEAPDEAEPAADADAGPNAAPRNASRAVPGPRHDPAESFARLSRAVRLTLALEARVDQELSALVTGEPGRAAESPLAGGDDDDGRYRLLSPDHPSAHRNRIRDAVFDVINREITELIPAHDILDALHERLTEGERYDDFVHRPFRETVAAICEDLGLHPDWSRWTDDGWPPPGDGPRKMWQCLWAPHRVGTGKRRLQ